MRSPLSPSAKNLPHAKTISVGDGNRWVRGNNGGVFVRLRGEARFKHAKVGSAKKRRLSLSLFPALTLEQDTRQPRGDCATRNSSAELFVTKERTTVIRLGAYDPVVLKYVDQRLQRTNVTGP
jgi:hypothetical protein